jgi:hypothetical protein
MAPATATTPLPKVLPIVEPPVSVPQGMQNTPDSVLEDVKRLLRKFPLFCAQVM